MFLKAYYSSDIFQINSHVPMIYYEPYYVKKILYFQHQIKLLLLNVKNKTLVTFVGICVNVTAPMTSSLCVQSTRLMW
jgi:hypothetical protein